MSREYIIPTNKILSLKKETFKNNKLTKVTTKKRNASSSNTSIVSYEFNYFETNNTGKNPVYISNLNEGFSQQLTKYSTTKNDNNGNEKYVEVYSFELKKNIETEYRVYNPNNEKMKLERDVLISASPLTTTPTANIGVFEKNSFTGIIPNTGYISQYYPLISFGYNSNWEREFTTYVQVYEIWHASSEASSNIDYYKYFNNRIEILGDNYETADEIISYGDNDENEYILEDNAFFTNNSIVSSYNIPYTNINKIYEDYINGKETFESEIIYSDLFDENNTNIINKEYGDLPKIGDIVRIYDSKRNYFLFSGKRFKLIQVEIRYNGVIKILIKGKEV